MKRYNLVQIMKDAHHLYNNDFQRRGRTWAECLKAAWSFEKSAVKVREEKAVRLNEMIASSWSARNKKANEPKKEINLDWSDCYNSNSRGYMGSQYCGD